MLKSFKYTKQPSGETSHRVVYPVQLVDDKMLSIDLTDLSDEERAEKVYILDAIRKKYIAAMKDAGFGSRYRYFFLEQMSNEQ